MTLLTLAGLISFCCTVHAKQPIRSSVSPGFLDGLHAKHLRYIADQLDMPIDIQPLSYARRLKALEQGQLDLMVGVATATEQHYDIVLLRPAYSQSTHHFFSKTNVKLDKFSDLRGKRIGITANTGYFKSFLKEDEVALVEVSGLDAKIKLLLADRIDAFSHPRLSTQSKLLQLHKHQQIVEADYHSNEKTAFHFASSKTSFLLEHKAKLEKIIVAATAEKKFDQIARQHFGLPLKAHITKH